MKRFSRASLLIFILLSVSAVIITACGSGGGGGGSATNATPPAVTSVSLPQTGQIDSYDANDPHRDDGALTKGVAWPVPRFTDNTDGTVTDNLTGLMWTKDGNLMPTKDSGWDTDGTANDGKVTWQHALDYVAKLNAENYLGYNDWRLPNRKELQSLIDRSKFNPALDIKNTLNGHDAFTNVQAGYYWSSTTVADYTGGAWVVDMGGGFVGYETKADHFYVWPVRSGGGGAVDLPKTGQTTCYNAAGGVLDPCNGTGQDGELTKGVAWPVPRFVIGGGAEADCVTDNLTGLMWVKTPDSTLRIWQAALTYTDGLTLCGYDDWRLPNVNEMESLVNAGEANSATWLNDNNLGFSNVQADYYWSSTTYANGTSYAWIVDMDDGFVSCVDKRDSYYVWPVRSGN